MSNGLRVNLHPSGCSLWKPMPHRFTFALFAGMAATLLAAGCSGPKDPTPAPGTIELPTSMPKPERVSKAELAKLPDNQLEKAVIDQVLLAIGQRFDREAEIVAEQPEGAQMVYATHYLEAEVMNGGFNQYLWNTDAKLAGLALRGYETFGAKGQAEVLKKAIALFPKERERLKSFQQRDTREAFAESYEKSPLDPLDTAFYDIDEKDSPSPRRIRFIRQNPEKCIR
jgi:hypothetical protein